MSNTKPSLGQALQLLNLINQKKTSLEKFNLLFTTGLFSDLLDADLENVNRWGFQKVIGLFDFTINLKDVPKGIDKRFNPELEFENGPVEYDLGETELWRHEDQKPRLTVLGKDIYTHLVDTGEIKLCMGLSDGVAIQFKGGKFFANAFGTDNRVYLWKSVKKCSDDLMVAYLSLDYKKEVSIEWNYLSRLFYYNEPAIRFKK